MMNGDHELEELRRAHERLETQVNAVLPTLATKTELNDGLASVRREMRAGFDEVNKRFDKMDDRFDKMDDRFERLDQKFERFFYVLLAGMGAAVLAAFALVSAVVLRTAPLIGAPPPPAQAAPVVRTLPATPPVAPPPRP